VILIVDDRPTNREFLVTLLGYHGHHLLQAADGAEALALARAERPDLVIADILMPTMDGYEFVRQLRADPTVADTRVIFYTAHYREQEARVLARACAVTAVVTKPAEPEVILEAVESALGHAPPPAPTPASGEFDRDHLRLLTDKLSENVDELRRANERLSALIDLGLQLGSELDLRRLLQSFTHTARDLIGARSAVVGILDGSGAGLRFVFTSGMDAETAARLGSPDPRAEALRGVLSDGRCLRLLNPGGDPVAIGLAPSYPSVRAWLAAPVASPTRVYGWYAMIDKMGVEEFSAEDERLAGILAAQVGRIYQNGSLYADVLRHASELEREVGERRRAEQRQATLLAVNQALAESVTLRDAARRILPAIGDRSGWELGSVWMTDQAANVLRCVEVWHAPSSDCPEWEARTLQVTFAPGTGLPGRVWLNKQPVWIPDVTREASFPRADVAAREGVRAALAFPILSGDRVLGVVEFDSRRSREPDRDLLEVFTGIGGPLGQFMERKQAEARLRERDEQIRLLLDSTAEGIYGIDLDGNCTFCNPAGLRLLGYTDASEVLGKNMHALAHHTRLNGILYPVEECLIYRAYRIGEGTHADHEVFWRADGSSFPVEYWSYPIRRGEHIVGSVVTFLDITERKQAEEAVVAAQRRLQDVVSSSPAVLFTLEGKSAEDLRSTWISENVQEMMGYSAGEVFQPNWWNERVHPEDLPRAQTEIQQNLFTHGRLADEYRFRHQNGQYRWVRSEMRLRRDALGNPVEVVGSWSDVTERRLLEDQFRQAQKMEAVGRLAGGVAHDFNNLLTVINGYGELLLASLQPSDPTREMIREMVAAGDRAAGLTRQLLAFSRKAILEPKILDLKTVLADIEKMLRRIIGEDIQLTVVADPESGSVRADPGQVEQVILNLIVNARDAMPRGGRITVELSDAELDETYALEHPEVRSGRYVLLAVTDTGCGMDQATVARVFEPFFTTKGEQGTGLGLATVHGIVKQSGGHVAVYSEVGHGTTFKVYLPRVEKPSPVGKLLAGPTEVPRGGETVLLVEDEDGVRVLSHRVLQSCGYTVLAARDGSEALRIAGEHAGRIDLLVTDVVMPRMSGREVAERLAGIHRGMKVLFLSAYTDAAVVRHGILEAEVAFLQKPFSPASLAAKVRKALDCR
jgi:PAS domain S-box-containing protein